MTAQVFAVDEGVEALDAAGYELGATIEDQNTWWNRLTERQADIEAEAARGRGRFRRLASPQRQGGSL